MKSAPRYHHGDLARAAVAAGFGLLDEGGAPSFTLAEVARRTGVSAAALYRHFADREALLAALAAAAFEELEAKLRRAAAPGRRALGRAGASRPEPLAGGARSEPDPRERVRRMTRAYLAYARRHPARYALMFTAGLDEAHHPALEAAGDRAFAVLCEALRDPVFQLPPAAVEPTALQVWALCHGFASLKAGLALGRGEGRLGLVVDAVEALIRRRA